MRENRTSSSMRGRRKRAIAQRACALLYRSPWLVRDSRVGGDSAGVLPVNHAIPILPRLK